MFMQVPVPFLSSQLHSPSEQPLPLAGRPCIGSSGNEVPKHGPPLGQSLLDMHAVAVFSPLHIPQKHFLPDHPVAVQSGLSWDKAISMPELEIEPPASSPRTPGTTVGEQSML